MWLYAGESTPLAATNLQDAVRAAHEAAQARAAERPIFGVRQAQDGAFELLQLTEGSPFGGDKRDGLHSDALGRRGDGSAILERRESVVTADASLLALVGIAAWRDPHTNELRSF